MAKAKKTKLKKTRQPRKPQPLPKSVQALLKYLGGSDVRVGGSSGGRPATLAPTAINIAISQQQQQQQTQQAQFVKQRVAPPSGTVIGKSPLSAIIPQQPVIVQQAPPSSAETERKIQEQARQAEMKQNELNRKFGMLEADQQQFRKAAAMAYQDIKQDISRRVTGDVNIFDARNIAQRFTPRPVVEEPQLPGMSFGEIAKEAEGISVTEVFRGVKEEESSEGLAGYLQEKYITDVSSPEMTPIQRSRGGPKKSEAEKAATKAATKKTKSSISTSEFSSSASLLESKQPTTLSTLEGGATSAPQPIRRTILVKKKKPIPIEGLPDMATQIALLTGGGQAAPSQSRGQTIAELLGAKKK